jgi:hypothetical protein
MMHQPSGGIGGTASDIKIQAEQMLYVKSTLADRIAFHTGQTVEQIHADSDRDRWFTADEAKSYGVVDHVIQRLECGGVDDLEVFETRERLAGHHRLARGRQLGGVGDAALECRLHRIEGSWYAHCGETLRWRQPPIATGQRQPVGLADRRHADHVDAHVEVAHHASDDRTALTRSEPLDSIAPLLIRAIPMRM